MFLLVMELIQNKIQKCDPSLSDFAAQLFIHSYSNKSRFQLNMYKSQGNILNGDASVPDSVDPGESGHREALPAVLLHRPGWQHQNTSLLRGLGRQDPRQEFTCR